MRWSRTGLCHLAASSLCLALLILGVRTTADLEWPPEPGALVAWLRENSGPADVFLTSESACVSMVAPSGRKCILAPRFFSSPYVDWNTRSDTYHAMWNSLVAGDCATFTRHANEHRLRFVMTVASRTPQVSAGQCGLVPMSFQGSSWRVYSVVGSQ